MIAVCTHKHRTDAARARCMLGDRNAEVIGSGEFGVVHECRSYYNGYGNKLRYTRWLKVYLFPSLEEASADYWKRREYCNEYERCSGTCRGQWDNLLDLRVAA